MSKPLLDIINTTNRVPIKLLHSVITEMYDNAKNYSFHDYGEQVDESGNPYVEIYRLLESVIAENLFVGSVNDFHNLSIELSRNDDDDYACKILEKGILVYPRSVDLLAGFLSCCTNCGYQDRGREIYANLKNIEKTNWNWRAFVFSIEFLKSLNDFDEVPHNDEILKIIEDFKTIFPEDDRAYYAEFDFFVTSRIDDRATLIKNFEIAISDKFPAHIRASHCTLRLAREYYENMEYDKSLSLINRYLIDSIHVSEDINNRGFAYLLSALCKLSNFYKLTPQEEFALVKGSDKERIVESIYSDFSYFKVFDKALHKRLLPLIKILSIQTDIRIDDDYDY